MKDLRKNRLKEIKLAGGSAKNVTSFAPLTFTLQYCIEKKELRWKADMKDKRKDDGQQQPIDRENIVKMKGLDGKLPSEEVMEIRREIQRRRQQEENEMELYLSQSSQ